MKFFERPRKKPSFLPVLLILLAVVCIGAVELLVCSYQDPELYDRVTAPVRAEVRRMAVAGREAWDQVDQTAAELSRTTVELGRNTAAAVSSAAEEIRHFLADLATRPKEDEEDVQLVDDEHVTPPPRPKASLSVTALEAREDGLDYLTGGARDVVYYDQTSERWAEERYGTDPIGGYGCGPTAMAMVVSTLTEMSMDPAQMAQHCVEQGYWAKKHGSYRTIVQGVAESFGLTCTSLPPEEVDEDTISRCLVSGGMIVALMGPGHFTNSGHFILLRGITLDGSILVADPASQERSLTTWDLDLLLEELSIRRHDGGPLWMITSSFLQ